MHATNLLFIWYCCTYQFTKQWCEIHVYIVHGARCTVHGARCTVHGARCTVHSTQYIVLHTILSSAGNDFFVTSVRSILVRWPQITFVADERSSTRRFGRLSGTFGRLAWSTDRRHWQYLVCGVLTPRPWDFLAPPGPNLWFQKTDARKLISVGSGKEAYHYEASSVRVSGFAVRRMVDLEITHVKRVSDCIIPVIPVIHVKRVSDCVIPVISVVITQFLSGALALCLWHVSYCLQWKGKANLIICIHYDCQLFIKCLQADL